MPASQWEAHRNAHKNAGKAPHWTSDGRKARTQALRRDGYRCQKCGITKAQLHKEGRTLHVHHVNGDPSDIRLSNLQSLCDRCHPRGGSRS